MPAWAYGPLAVHISWEADAWCVTHVASGYTVCRLPHYDGAHEIAAGMAGFNWSIPDPNHPPGPLRVEVTMYLRDAWKKYPELTAAAIDLEPAKL